VAAQKVIERPQQWWKQGSPLDEMTRKWGGPFGPSEGAQSIPSSVGCRHAHMKICSRGETPVAAKTVVEESPTAVDAKALLWGLARRWRRPWPHRRRLRRPRRPWILGRPL
jgi:hypothetical protein